jgi:lipoprotein-releasing system permease protein
MKTLSLFLAWRYLRGAWQEKTVSTMVKVCFLGIFIGTFSLALVLSVMHGFEQVTHEKMQGIHANIIIRSDSNYLHMKALEKILSQVPGIEAWAPSDSKQIILQNQDDPEMTEVMILKGIDPRAEAQTTALESKLLPASEKKLSKVLRRNQIIIGKKAAENLHLFVGDTVNLLFSPQEPQGRKIVLDSVSAVVGGIFKTGIDEFDSNVLFSSLDWFLASFEDVGISQVGVRLSPNASEEEVLSSLRNNLEGLTIFSWKDLYPALVSALKLEKYVMFLILALITLVASMNIISLLFMQITQKVGDIAILQAMGCSVGTLSRTFFYSSFFLSLLASSLGLGLAALACLLLERYPFIELPDIYYVTHLPAKMEPWLFLIVFILVNALTLVSTWLPIKRIRHINIAKVLRFEA